MKDKVDQLIANGMFAESDREALMALPEETLSKMPVQNDEPAPAAPAAPAAEGDVDAELPAPEVEVDAEVVANAFAKAIGVDVSSLQSAMAQLVGNNSQQRSNLVAGLVANEKCTMNETQLNALDNASLQSLQGMLGSQDKPQAHYGGQAGAWEIVANEEGDEPLVAGGLDFS